MTRSPQELARCSHGHPVNECPHPATVCNYSRDYAMAKCVSPPAGAWVHPKVLAWIGDES